MEKTSFKQSLFKLIKKKSVIITAVVLAVAISIPLILRAGIQVAAATYKTWSPDYDKVDISFVLDREEFTDEEYDLLFEQTGLTRIGIDDFVKEGKQNEILRIQRYFFEEPDYYCNIFHFCFGMFTKSYGRYPNAILEDGDIIYSPSTYISFVELAHSAIVTDGERGIIAEAYGYGTNLDTCTASSFFVYPAFVILRPKATAELRGEVADYVTENMIDTPYDILTGIFGKKAPENLKTTHCSHLPWYAYNKFGIDLDSNGGKIVTPKDILNSPYLEVVQVFGIDIEEFR